MSDREGAEVRPVSARRQRATQATTIQQLTTVQIMLFLSAVHKLGGLRTDKHIVPGRENLFKPDAGNHDFAGTRP